MKSIERSDQSKELPFEVKERREGLTLYIFKGLAIAIDVTGKNYKELPELSFGPYDNELHTGTLDQPDQPNEALNMQYVVQCISEVVKYSGINKFWVYPYSGDAADENKERRKKARMKLFEKVFSNIQPAPEGHGYILTAENSTVE